MNQNSKSQAPKTQARSAARLGAVQALYQQQMEGTKLAKLLDEFHQHRLGRVIEDEEYADADVDFFDDLVSGVDARREERGDGRLPGRGLEEEPSRKRRRQQMTTGPIALASAPF